MNEQLGLFSVGEDATAVLVPAAGLTQTRAAPAAAQPVSPDAVIAAPEGSRTPPGLYRPPSGSVSRVNANLAALEVLADLENHSNPQLTDAQRDTLAAWSSWGAVSEVFDKNHPRLGRFQAPVADALGTDFRYSAAARTTLNAHYTTPEVAAFMWGLLARAGIEPGAALEPGCGSGVFIAAAPAGWHVTGIEADPTTAQIARLLHPAATIHTAEMQQWTRLRDYDAAIGNVPFSDVSPFDAKLNPSRALSLHNYCLLRGLEALRPGGLLVALTSMFTMDARTAKSRETLSRYGIFRGAIRLPNTAFRRHSGTAAVTDMVIMQRRVNPLDRLDDVELTDAEQLWLGTDQAEDWYVNSWYAHQRELMLGVLAKALMYGGNGHTLEPHDDADDIAVQLAEAAEHPALREGLDAAAEMTQRLPARPVPAPAGPARDETEGRAPTSDDAAGRSREGTIISEGGRFYQLRGGRFERFSRPGRSADPQGSAAELRALLAVRDARLELMNRENDPDCGTDSVEQARSLLNDAYDAHQAGGWGHLSRVPRKSNGTRLPWRASGFVSDPHYHLVRALDDPARVEAGHDDVRSAILLRRAVAPPPDLAGTAETVPEAVAISMARTGGVYLDEVSRALGREVTAQGMAPAAFFDPAVEAWTPAARYLAGNVRARLAEARAAAHGDRDMAANIAALEEVQPEHVRVEDIEVALGVPWITPEEVQEFARELLDTPTLAVVRPTSTWSVDVDRWELPIGSLRTERWGIPQTPAERLLEKILNRTSLAVYERQPDGSRVVNPEATLQAAEIAQAWQDAFRAWCFDTDDDRAQRLEDRFNDHYSGWVVPSYEPWPRPPGLAEGFDLRPHQARSVARIIHEGALLLAHEVGSGKTATMCAAAMELRRLGKAQKPMIVVPQNLVDQFASEFARMFPNAELLVFSRGDGSARAAREEFAGRCASHDWDCVIVSDTAFTAMPISEVHALSEARDYVSSLQRRHEDWMANGGDEASIARLELDIEEATRQLRSTLRPFADDADGLNELGTIPLESMAKETVKRVERDRLARQERFRSHDAVHTGTIAFEDLGVDFVIVDEAHNYKNLSIDSTSELLGRKREGSKRATDLDRKLAWLRRRHNGEPRCVLATGTPVSNELHELWVMQHFVQPHVLEELGMGIIDPWLAMFAGEVLAPEVRITGAWRMKTRVATYRNLPELMRLSGQQIELLSYDQLGLPRPDLAGGDATVVEVPASDVLRDYIAELGAREEALSPATREVDNMLKICNDARAAALHLGLVGRLQPEPSKLDYAAERIVRLWHAHRDRRFEIAPGVEHPRPGALQLVFMDLGTPGGGAALDLYGLLRDKLTDAGMDPERIKFFHDRGRTAREREAFDDQCRTGGVDVLIASTAKAGVGLNIQDRMCALHHMDAPWRPADVTQREGRLVRQGNQFDEVEIFRYAAIGTFDAFSWQVLERKQSFIEQLCSLRPGQRRVTDLDADIRASFRNVKAIATGDIRLVREIELEQRVDDMHRSQSAHRSATGRARHRIDRRHDDIATFESALGRLAEVGAADPATAQAEPSEAVFRDADGRVIAERADIEMRHLVARALRARDRGPLGTINGAPIHAWRNAGDFAVVAIGSEDSPLRIDFNRDELDKSMMAQRLRNLLARRGELAASYRRRLEDARADIEVLRAEADRAWPNEDELAELTLELAELSAEIRASQRLAVDGTDNDVGAEGPDLDPHSIEPAAPAGAAAPGPATTPRDRMSL